MIRNILRAHQIAAGRGFPCPAPRASPTNE
jgi:hypothetical protein